MKKRIQSFALISCLCIISLSFVSCSNTPEPYLHTGVTPANIAKAAKLTKSSTTINSFSYGVIVNAIDGKSVDKSGVYRPSYHVQPGLHLIRFLPTLDKTRNGPYSYSASERSIIAVFRAGHEYELKPLVMTHKKAITVIYDKTSKKIVYPRPSVAKRYSFDYSRGSAYLKK